MKAIIQRLRPLRRVLVVFAALSVSPFVAGGTVSVSRSTTAPTDDILFAFTGGDNEPTAGGQSWRSAAAQATDGKRDLGQTFSLSETINLESITVRSTATSSGFANTDYTLSIYKLEAVTGSPVILDTYAFSGTFSANYASGYLTFSLDSSVLIEADQAYGFLFSFDDPAVASSVALQIYSKPAADGVRPWPGQRLLMDTGSGLTTSEWQTLEFHLGGTVIPEPSSIALLIGAFAGLAVAGCRRPRR